MRLIVLLVVGIILTVPEAWAWQWLSNLIMNPYGQHGLDFSTCFGISIAVGAIVFLYQLGHELKEMFDN